MLLASPPRVFLTLLTPELPLTPSPLDPPVQSHSQLGRGRVAGEGGGGGEGGMQLFILKLDVFSSEGEILQWDWLENRSSFMIMIGSA